MIQSKTSSPRGSKVPFESQRVMAIEVPSGKEIFGVGRKEVGSAIRRRRANRGSINIKEREQGELFREMLTPT